MDIEGSLRSMVEVAKEALDLGDYMALKGYGETPYWKHFGMIADAIYCLIGEKQTEFSDSVTFRVLNNKKLSVKQSVRALMSEYEKNQSAQ